LIALSLIALPALVCAAQYEPRVVHDVDFLTNGNLLVTDGGVLNQPGTSGIYEIDRDGNIVWSYTAGLNFAHNADRQPNGQVIISDTANNRVLIVDPAGQIVWNSAEVPLSDGSTLQYPNNANLLPSGNRLITDRNNQRVIEISAAGTVVWQFGQTGVPGGGADRLNGPHGAERLANGNTLIADSNNNRIIEVTPGKVIVWVYAAALNWPRDADRLPNGNTLIDDSNNRRITEVTPAGNVVWGLPLPDVSYDADRLATGNTLISSGARIIEVNPAGSVVWSYPPTYETEVIEGYLVTAPNGNRLWVKIIQPREDLYPGESFPAVVDVPGGLGAGADGNLLLAASGFVEFHFNAEGRGVPPRTSDGVEDYNGFVHQDDLLAMIEYAYARPNVATNNLGVTTCSYGITMGAGCLGRYPALPVKYLIDKEGPSDNYVSSFEPWALDDDPSNDRHELAYQVFGHWSLYRDPSPENEAWWSQREATHFIGQIRCRYLRVQAAWDHAQPPNADWPGFDYYPLWYPGKHTVDMINLATLGQAPWTRVNAAALGNPPNQTYDHDSPPNYYSQAMSDHPGESQHIVREQAAMPPLALPGDLNCDGVVGFGDLNPFVLYLANFTAWQAAHPGCPAENGDINGNGTYPSFDDINPFVALLSGV
jgi:hypothetical protein